MYPGVNGGGSGVLCVGLGLEQGWQWQMWVQCRVMEVQLRMCEQGLTEPCLSSLDTRRAREDFLGSAGAEERCENWWSWTGGAATGPEATGGNVANSNWMQGKQNAVGVVNFGHEAHRRMDMFKTLLDTQTLATCLNSTCFAQGFGVESSGDSF